MNCMYLGLNFKKTNVVEAFLDQLKKPEHRLVINILRYDGIVTLI